MAGVDEQGGGRVGAGSSRVQQGLQDMECLEFTLSGKGVCWRSSPRRCVLTQVPPIPPLPGGE